MATLILIIGISVLILIHELGHFFAARWAGLLVEEFGFGFPPRIWSKKIGETVYSVNLLPFGGFVKIYGEQPGGEGEKASEAMRKRSFIHQVIWKRAVIIVAGVVMNFLLGWAIYSGLYMAGSSTNALVIGGITPETPAAEAGLMTGDVLTDFRTADELLAFVQTSKGQATEFNIQRGVEKITVTMTPRVVVPEGQGALGIEFTEVNFPKLPFFESITQGFKTSVATMGQIFKVLGNLVARIFTFQPAFEDVVGPVGIFRVANRAAEIGFFWLIQLIALISLNLAALNVFPFPALDGGRLLFLVVEKIKGSPISPKKEGIVNAIGFALLIILMIVITVKDIGRFF